ncbi:MAG: deaminase, partial [Glaciecola sp.]|nr:deaminase [Glaciecola sp.]
MSDLSLLAQDELWMIHALTLADKAEGIGEVPVGAVIVLDNQIIGECYNRSIIDNFPCGHAEIMAI